MKTPVFQRLYRRAVFCLLVRAGAKSPRVLVRIIELAEMRRAERFAPVRAASPPSPARELPPAPVQPAVDIHPVHR
jgi:hypothetical protein